jgi:hypothetical protein
MRRSLHLCLDCRRFVVGCDIEQPKRGTSCTGFELLSAQRESQMAWLEREIQTMRVLVAGAVVVAAGLLAALPVVL